MCLLFIHLLVYTSINFHSFIYSFLYIHSLLRPSFFNLSISFVHLTLYPSIIVFAMFGMLSPASRGALMTASILLFMFMG